MTKPFLYTVASDYGSFAPDVDYLRRATARPLHFLVRVRTCILSIYAGHIKLTALSRPCHVGTSTQEPSLERVAPAGRQKNGSILPNGLVWQ